MNNQNVFCQSSLRTPSALQSIRSHKAVIITDKSQPKGIATDSETARLLVGDRIWDLTRNGLCTNQMCGSSFTDNDFFVVKKKDVSMNVVFFGENFINENWQDIQLALPAKFVTQMADTFNKPVFPHIALETLNTQFLKVSSNAQTPYVSLSDIRKDLDYNGVSNDLNAYGSPLKLVTKCGFSNPLQVRDYATLVPVKLTEHFENAGVEIIERSANAYFAKTKTDIPNNAVLSIRELLPANSEALTLIAPKDASPTIQSIIDAHSPTYHTLDTTPLRAPTQEESNERRLKNLQVAAVISAHITESEARNRTIGSWVTCPSGKQEFIAVTANKQSIDLVQKLALNNSTYPRTAGEESVIQYAFDNRDWFRDQNLQYTVFEEGSKKRDHFSKIASANIKALFKHENSYTLLEEKSSGDQCLVTGSQDIARALYTIERAINIK